MALSTGAKVAIGIAVVGTIGGIAAVALAKEEEVKEPERPKIDPAFSQGCIDAGGIPVWVEESGEWGCKAKDGTITLQSQWGKEEEAEPIYAFCEERGGRIEAVEGHPPLCVFPDGRAVDAWEYLRGEAEPTFLKPPEGPGGEEPEKPPTDLVRPDEVLDTDVVLAPGASVHVDPSRWDIERIWVVLPYEAWGDFKAWGVEEYLGEPLAGVPSGAATVVEQVGMGEPGQPGAVLFVRWQVTEPGQVWLYHEELNTKEQAWVSVLAAPLKHTRQEPVVTFETGE